MPPFHDKGEGRRAGSPLWELFRRGCAAQPGELLVDGRLRLSGPAALSLAGGMAAAMGGWNAGGRNARRIGFLCRPGAAHAAAWFAVHALGAVPVNLHVRESARRLADTLDCVGLDWLVCDRDLAEQATAVVRDAAHAAGIATLAADGALDILAPPRAGGPGAPSFARESWEGRVAGIIMSSGSTGQPKAICHDAQSLLWSAAAGSVVYGRLSPADATLVCMGTSFAAWTNVVVPFLAAGAKLCFDAGFDPATFLHKLAAERITVAPLVPSMWNMVLQAASAPPDLGALRVAMTSGEPVRASLAERLRERICPTIHAGYLSSEGLCGTAIVADERDLILPGAPGCIGRPIPFTEAKIAVAGDDGGERDAAPGETGELLLRGPSMALGYLGQPELSAERFAGGWWRTGDLASTDGEGRFFSRGRTDNLINSGGIKVHAEEVEAALMAHPAVLSAAVVGLPDPAWGQRIEAFVVLRPGQPESVDFAAFLEQQDLLPRLKRPKAVHLRAALPVGPTGKLYRKALLEEAARA